MYDSHSVVPVVVLLVRPEAPPPYSPIYTARLFHRPRICSLNSRLYGYKRRIQQPSTIFLNAPWKIAHKCIQHIRECHSKDPKGTKAVIILPDWPTFKELTSDLKLLRTIPGKQQVFTKSPDNDASLRTPVESFRWPVNYWVIDKDTPVLSEYLVREQTVPSSDTAATETETVDADPSETEEAEVIPENIARDAANKYLPTAAAYVIMDPDHPEPLMRVPITINDHHTDALIDNAATLNFVSKSFIEKHELLQCCTKAPKVAVRVANSQRVSSWKLFIPKSLIINTGISRFALNPA